MSVLVMSEISLVSIALTTIITMVMLTLLWWDSTKFQVGYVPFFVCIAIDCKRYIWCPSSQQ